jgi:hypothetical protein
MNDDCWLCCTPPGTMTRKIHDTCCTCGFALYAHGYGHPHALAVVGCPAFLAALPLPPLPPPEPDAQPALF